MICYNPCSYYPVWSSDCSVFASRNLSKLAPVFFWQKSKSDPFRLSTWQNIPSSSLSIFSSQKLTLLAVLFALGLVIPCGVRENFPIPPKDKIKDCMWRYHTSHWNLGLKCFYFPLCIFFFLTVLRCTQQKINQITILSVQLNGIECVRIIVQPSPTIPLQNFFPIWNWVSIPPLPSPCQLPFSSLSPWIWYYLFHVSEVIQCLSFCVWIISFSIVFSTFIRVVECARMFFL